MNNLPNRSELPKFETECALVTRLLEALGVSGVASDPKWTYGQETGADVEVRLDGHRIGIQVTEYHGDEGIDEDMRGSAIRAQEELDWRKDKDGILHGYAVPADPLSGLTKRFCDKLAKANCYTFKEFSEVWLLVAAFLPKQGAVAATSVMPIFITSDWLNQHFGKALSASKYQRVFLHMHLCHALYEWSLSGGWRTVVEPEKLTPNVANGELWFKQLFADPELLRDPEGWVRREAQRVLQDLRSDIKSPQQDVHRQGGYIMKTGMPRWSVGCVQNGLIHDAGFRWIVCERSPGGESQPLAYTHKRKAAEIIVASLERTESEGGEG